MQELRMYSIRDQKAEFYGTPFFFKTHGEAERAFQQLVADEKSMVAQHPEDFDLYYLGTYNDQTGVPKGLDTPQHVTKAVHLKRAKPVSEFANVAQFTQA